MKAICFVCGSKGANSILHVKPRSKGAYFSFLESHDPPRGAKLPNGEGVVSACLVCYAFLNQQWDSFEKTKTPLVKRLYWLKRIDNRSFTGAELNVQGEYVAQIMGVQYNCGLSGNISPFDYGSHTGISCSIKDALPSPTNDSNLSPAVDHPAERGLNGVLDLSVSPKKPKAHSKKSQRNEDASITHTLKALGTNGSKVLGTSGSKVLGTSGSKVPGTNSSKSVERGSDVVSSAKQKSGSVVCYVCCKTCPLSLARFVYAIKYSDDEPYFPFILGLVEPPGAMALTKNGVTQVCSECRKTLSRQWRIFESRKVAEMERVYKINDAPIIVEKTTKENGDGGVASVAARSGGSACYLCGEITLLSTMYTLKTREEETEEGMNRIVLPFIEKLKCPLGARPIDSRGLVLVCALCHKHIHSQWKTFEEKKLPLDRREYMLRPFLNANNSSLSFPGNMEKNHAIESAAAAEKRNSQRTPLFLLRDGEMTPSNEGKEFNALAKDALDPFLFEQSDRSRTVVAFSDGAASFRMPFPSPLLLKMDCNKNMMTKVDASTCAEGSTCNGRHSSSVKEENHESSADVQVSCFLCGCKCRRLKSTWKGFVSIYDRPDVAPSSEDNKTCFFRPFFPFLSTVSPSGGAGATNDGRFDVCYVCYHNLVSQWFSLEKSKDLEEQNRWLRKYRFRCFTCSLCKQNCERQKMELLMLEEASPVLPVSVDGLVSIEGSDCALVCSNCRTVRLNGEGSRGRSGQKRKRTSAGGGSVTWSGGQASRLDAEDEKRKTKASSNASLSSSSSSPMAPAAAAAAVANQSDKRSLSSSSPASSTSSFTDADVKTMTGVMSSADAATESGEALCRRRRRKRDRKMEEETTAPPMPSHHLFPRPAAAASVASSPSSSSNSYLEALRRMTIDSCLRPTTNTCLHTHDVTKRSETESNGSQMEERNTFPSSAVKDNNLSMEKKLNFNEDFTQRRFHVDEINTISDRRSCNGLLLAPVEAKKEEEDEDSLRMQRSRGRRRCSSRTNSSLTKVEDLVFSTSSTPTKKTRSPSSQSGVFPSSPLPPPPVDAVSDASGGRLDCNGFIPPSSDGMLNSGPFHPSLIRHPPLHPSPQQLSSSASSSSFMSPDGLYLPQLVGSSSSPLFGFLHPPPPPLPSSSSALRWEECLAMMQKLQQQQQQQHQLLSSPSYNVPYSSIFPPPSLIHPLLQPSAISSPFFFAPDRSSASVALSSNAFDLSNVFSRDIYERRESPEVPRSHDVTRSHDMTWSHDVTRSHDMTWSHDMTPSHEVTRSPSDMSETESGGWLRSGALRRKNGCSGPKEVEEGENQTPGSDLLIIHERRHQEDKDSGRDGGRLSHQGKVKQRKDTKPNFHRPFLENCSGGEEEEEEDLEVERTDPPFNHNETFSTGNNHPVKDDVDETCRSALKTESYSSPVMALSIGSNALIETNHSRLIADFNHAGKNGHLVTQPKKLLSTGNGYSLSDVVQSGSSHLMSKEELLNAALSLISLQSPRLLSLTTKRTTEQRDDSTVALNNESTDNGSRCHRSTNNDDISPEDTSPCKRLRVDDIDHHLVTDRSSSSSSPSTNNRNCRTKDNIFERKKKQSLPVDRLLSSPLSSQPPEGEDEKRPPPPSPPMPPSPLSSSSSVSDEGRQRAMLLLQWPGLEMIIESYQQHCNDCALERRFLFDRERRCADQKRDLLSSTETFSAKIVELTRMQHDLESERAELQSFLDNLTSCLRQLRR